MKIVRAGLLLTAAAAVLGAGGFRHAYPGFSEEIVAEMRHAGWRQIVDDAAFIWYNVEYLQQMRPDPETGIFDLEEAARELDAHPRADVLEKAKMSYHRGDFAAAIETLATDVAAGKASEAKLLWLALSYQRRGELAGCLVRRQHNPEAVVCSLPATAGHHDRHHANPDFEAAAELFEKLLDDYDSDDEIYLWLLNFLHMAQGSFPAAVPERYRVDGDFVDAFYGDGYRRTAGRFSHLAFQDRAQELGVDLFDAGKAVAVEDFDGDGWLDLVTGGSSSTLRYFRNDRGQRFVDETEAAGLADVLQPFIVTAADYDGDGHIDLFVGRPYQRFNLFRNLGPGTSGTPTFVNVTREAGLLDDLDEDDSTFTFVSAWADVDNDGDLDLFLAHVGRRLPLARGVLAKNPAPSRLYIQHDGRFVDANDRFGIAELLDDRVFTGAAFGDWDSDGWQDLFLSSFTRGNSVLLHNRGGQSFAATELIHNPAPGFMTSFVDVDHDGRLDLFQGGNGPARGVLRDVVFEQPGSRYDNLIYLNRGDGFKRRPDLFGGGMAISTMGATFGDLDNDGCHDFYLGTGNSEAWFVLPNLLYFGERDGARCTGAMTNASMLWGFGSIQKGHGTVFFDFDNDGDQDVYSSLGGMWPQDRWPNQLFVNDSRLDHAWIKIRLRGRHSNRFGVGATIRVVAHDPDGDEIVRYARIDQRTGFGSAPLLAHIGLLDAVAVERVDVNWPRPGPPQTYAGVLGKLNLLDENGGQSASRAPGDGPTQEPRSTS